MSLPDPLLVTLQCSGPGWMYCEDLRSRHFPAARNVVPAHIMLFHSLPGEELERIASQAGEVAASHGNFTTRVTGIRSLGKGVSLRVESPELLEIHRELSTFWTNWLSPQDRARYVPHVTIQNKVTSKEASSLMTSLIEDFMPFEFDSTGINIWHYRGGPWEHAVFLAFAKLEGR